MREITPAVAHEALLEARHARQSAERPRQRFAAHAFYSLMGGAGVAALGQLPGHTPGHLVVMAIGVALLALAYALPARARSRSGLHGYRGQSRSDNIVFLIVAVVLVICAIPATMTTAVIYGGLGVVSAIAYFLVLRNHRLMAR